jgi:hypothetical protein
VTTVPAGSVVCLLAKTLRPGEPSAFSADGVAGEASTFSPNGALEQATNVQKMTRNEEMIAKRRYTNTSSVRSLMVT